MSTQFQQSLLQLDKLIQREKQDLNHLNYNNPNNHNDIQYKKTLINDVLLNDYNSNQVVQEEEENDSEVYNQQYGNQYSNNQQQQYQRPIQKSKSSNTLAGTLNKEAQQLADLLNQVSSNIMRSPTFANTQQDIQGQFFNNNNQQNNQQQNGYDQQQKLNELQQQLQVNNEQQQMQQQQSSSNQLQTPQQNSHKQNSAQSITTKDTEEENYSFRPMLSKKSMMIAEKLPESSRERLSYSNLRTQNKLEKLKQQIDQDKYCFTPKINKKRSTTQLLSSQQNGGGNSSSNIQSQQQFQQPQIEQQNGQLQQSHLRLGQNNKQEVFNRLYTMGKQQKQRRQDVQVDRIYQQQTEIDPECTFQPKLNSKSQKIISQYSQVQRSQDFLKAKQQKLDHLRNQHLVEKQVLEQQNYTFTPQICKYSQEKINFQNQPEEYQKLALKGCEQFYERLDKAKRQKQEKEYQMKQAQNQYNGKYPKGKNGNSTKIQQFNLSQTNNRASKSIEKNSSKKQVVFDMRDVNYNQIVDKNVFNNNNNYNSNGSAYNNLQSNRKVKSKSPLKIMEANYDRMNNKVVDIQQNKNMMSRAHTPQNIQQQQYLQQQQIQQQIQSMKKQNPNSNNIQQQQQQQQQQTLKHSQTFNPNSHPQHKLKKEKYMIPDFVDQQQQQQNNNNHRHIHIEENQNNNNDLPQFAQQQQDGRDSLLSTMQKQLHQELMDIKI